MAFGKSREFRDLPTGNAILGVVSELDIYQMYLGEIPRGLISSPFREDVHPSFSLYHSREYGKVFYKDFSTGESGDCFVFVMRLFRLSSKIETFNKIASDFNMSQFTVSSPSSFTSPIKLNKNSAKSIKKSTRLRISVTIRNWEIKDKEYWFDKYGLLKSHLEHSNIFPISHYFINGYCTKTLGLAYAFVEEKDGVQTFKIYQPKADKLNKWINNNDYSTWELWTQLPKNGRVCIIASSRKDSVVIKSLFDSKTLTSCSLQSEGVSPKKSVVDELRSRFDHVFIMYDNDYHKKDNPGRKAANKLSEKTGFDFIEIPDAYKIKDPSDFIEKFNSEDLKSLIKNLIKKKLNK